MQTPEEFVKASLYPEKAFVAVITARDAEWQARVDRLEAALINLTVAVEEHDFLSCSLIAQTQDARAALGRE